MKRKIIALSAGVMLLIAGVFMAVLFHNPAIEVNNTTTAKELVTRKYGLEKELLAKAIFYVRRGFGDVYARDLAKEVGFRLECKRQISDSQFYYVIVGDYRCFMIVDEKDIVREVLTVKEFPTIEQTKEWLDKYDEEFEGFITDTLAYGFNSLWRNVGSSSVYLNYQFTLRDGVMVIKTIGKLSNAEYLFFTDEEWQHVYEDWDGFVILPIDKQ